MTFRYIPFWLYLLSYAAGVALLVSIFLVVAFGLEIVVAVFALDLVVPSLAKGRWLFL